jgi:hypothetical protein
LVVEERKQQEDGENYIIKSFIACTNRHVIRGVKSRRMKWADHVIRTGEVRNAYKILVGETEGKRPLGRSTHGKGGNIRLDLRETVGRFRHRPQFCMNVSITCDMTHFSLLDLIVLRILGEEYKL